MIWQKPAPATRSDVTSVPAEALTRDRRLGVLSICCLSLLIVGLDITALNVALPVIGKDLDVGVSGLQWTVDAFIVVMASLLMFAGSMGDRLGRRRVFVAGLALFSAASVLCAVAPTVEVLIAARALQGVGASMLNPVAMAIITNTFTDPRERAQAVGVWGAVFGISMALGPIVGGALVAASGWEAIFLLNVPIGLTAIALTLRFVPESRAPRARRFDPVGQALVFVLISALTFSIIEAPARGWTAPLIVVTLSAAAGALAGLLAYEPRRDEPLIDLRFFRSTPFSASIAISVAAFGAFGGFLFLNTLYLQQVRDLSPVQAGLAVLPMALMTIVMSPISGRMVGRRGPRIPLVVSGTATLIGCAMLTGVSPTTPFAHLIGAYVVFGFGFGLVNAPITSAAVSGMPRAQAGVAAAIATTSRQVGQALGVAIVGAIATAHAVGTVSGASTAATHPAWWLLTACGGVVLVLGLVATSSRADASARRTAAVLNPEALPATVDTARRPPVAGPDVEQQLAERVHGGDQHAREELLLCLRGLARDTALPLARPGQSACRELVRDADILLLEAMDAYDPRRGVPFTTFAARRLRRKLPDSPRARKVAPAA